MRLVSHFFVDARRITEFVYERIFKYFQPTFKNIKKKRKGCLTLNNKKKKTMKRARVKDED